MIHFLLTWPFLSFKMGRATIWYQSWKEYKGIWYKIKRWQVSSFQDFSIHCWIITDLYSPIYSRRQVRESTEIPQVRSYTSLHSIPACRKINCAKGWVTVTVSTLYASHCIINTLSWIHAPMADNSFCHPRMQTRPHVAKNWEIKNSLGLKVTFGNMVLNYWPKND